MARAVAVAVVRRRARQGGAEMEGDFDRDLGLGAGPRGAVGAEPSRARDPSPTGARVSAVPRVVGGQHARGRGLSSCASSQAIAILKL